VRGELRFKNFEHGQTILSLVGTLESDERTDSAPASKSRGSPHFSINTPTEQSSSRLTKFVKDKFTWKEGPKEWAAYSVTVDKSAKEMLAHFMELDTYSHNIRFHEANGSLLRIVKENVEGTRSAHILTGIRVPKPASNRLVEIWQVCVPAASPSPHPS
ncbi:hypothetical protein TrRE_jg11490, partial [Triparma retinervis]